MLFYKIYQHISYIICYHFAVCLIFLRFSRNHPSAWYFHLLTILCWSVIFILSNAVKIVICSLEDTASDCNLPVIFIVYMMCSVEI